MVRAADRRVVLVDHSKIGGASLAPFCAWAELDAMVSDRPLPGDMARSLQDLGVRILVAG
jgi:DeoR/GlpR family transcriptional regulator of sugar metabolism